MACRVNQVTQQKMNRDVLYPIYLVDDAVMVTTAILGLPIMSIMMTIVTIIAIMNVRLAVVSTLHTVLSQTKIPPNLHNLAITGSNTYIPLTTCQALF